MNNRRKIDQLKEEYKAHYRAMQDTAKRAHSTRRKTNIVSALKAMDSEEIFRSMETAMDSIRGKITRTEARLEVLMEDWFDESQYDSDIEDFEKEQRTAKVQKTINEIRVLTEQYESDLDDLINNLNASKTLGQSGRDQKIRTGLTGDDHE